MRGTHARIVARSIVRTVPRVPIVATQLLPFPYPYVIEQRTKEGKLAGIPSSYLVQKHLSAGHHRGSSGVLYRCVRYSSCNVEEAFA